ncbi:MAG TPA: glycosyltransferase, partial [Pseudonocardiaceae bacterium]
MFVPAAGERADELVPRAIEWKPDLVVHEISELAGAIAAAHIGARHVVHSLGQTPPGVWELFAPGLAALSRRWDVPELPGRLLEQTYVDLCPPSLQPGGPADVGRVRPAPPRPPAGEVVPGERLPGTARCSRRCRTPTPSPDPRDDFHETPGVFEAALAGLRELPVNVVLTLGPGADPRRFGPQPPHVLIADYVSQALLLPLCSLVVSHGGAGSIHGALCHGLPQLILPQGADNFLGAAACERAGVAVALQPGELTPDAVAAAVRRLLTEPAFGTAARTIQAEIATMPDADAVLAALTAEDR